MIFTPARGKAFSGTENGFVAYKTHLAIFYKFLTFGKTSKLALLSLNRNFLTKIEIRHGRIGVSVERQAQPLTSPVLHLCPLRLVTPLQSNGDLECCKIGGWWTNRDSTGQIGTHLKTSVFSPFICRRFQD